MLTHERAHELFNYDPDTGILTRKISTAPNARAGDIAGSIGGDGYLQVSCDNKKYSVHRVVFLMIRGFFPEHHIDHRDQTRTNNRASNLREASFQCNARNRGNPATNTSGVKGVYKYKHKRTDRWRATITVFGQNKHLGRYKDFDEAVCARLAAEQCLNWEGCDSSSPAYQYVKGLIS